MYNFLLRESVLKLQVKYFSIYNIIKFPINTNKNALLFATKMIQKGYLVDKYKCFYKWVSISIHNLLVYILKSIC